MKSILSKLIIIVLAAGLIISLGVGSEFISFGMDKNIIAKVDKMEVTKKEFIFFKNKKLSELSSSIKGNKDFMKILDYQIVDMIVQRKLLAREAKNLGFHISNEKIRQYILNTEAFKDIVTIANYETAIRRNFDLDVDVFEQILIEENLSDKYYGFIKEFLFINNDEAFQEFLKNETSMNYYKIELIKPINFKNTFTDSEIEEFKKTILSDKSTKDSFYKFFKINSYDLNKNENITDSDLKSYYENYKSGEEFNKEKIKREIKEKISDKLITNELKIISALVKTENINEISKKYNKEIKVFNISSLQVPSNIKTKIKTSKGLNFIYYDKSIWVFELTDNEIFQKDLVVNQMKVVAEKNSKKEFYNNLINIYKTNPDDFLDKIKSDNRLQVSFYNNQKAVNLPLISKKALNQTESKKNINPYLIDYIFEDDKFYLIFIEKLRLPDSELFILDKDRIKNSLLIDKTESFFEKLNGEIISNNKIELNTKYFKDD